MFDIKKLFTNGSSVGRYEYIKILISTLSFAIFIWLLFPFVSPNSSFYIPLKIITIFIMSLSSIFFWFVNYKRISNIFDNTTKTIIAFVLLLFTLPILTIIFNPIYILIIIILLFGLIRGKKSSDKFVSNSLFGFCFIFSICMYVFTHFSCVYLYILNNSMVPTIMPRENVVTNIFNNNYKRGHIVAYQRDNYIFIGRIIGLPNEKIEIKRFDDSSSYVFINDKKLIEPYIENVFAYPDIVPINNIVIPDENYYILGDNRGLSKDSRYVGVIPKSDIKGIINNTYINQLDIMGKAKVFETPNYIFE